MQNEFFWTSTYLFWEISKKVGICNPKKVKCASYNEIQQMEKPLCPLETQA